MNILEELFEKSKSSEVIDCSYYPNLFGPITNLEICFNEQIGNTIVIQLMEYVVWKTVMQEQNTKQNGFKTLKPNLWKWKTFARIKVLMNEEGNIYLESRRHKR